MNKFYYILLIMIFITIPVASLGYEKGKGFALVNIYEVLEFACYFIFVYLTILAKIFESLNITRNQKLKK